MQRGARSLMLVTACAVLVVGLVLLGVVVCRQTVAKAEPVAADPLMFEAASVPPGQASIRLVSREEHSANEARFEWAILASLQSDSFILSDADRKKAANHSGWTVIRCTATLRGDVTEGLDAGDFVAEFKPLVGPRRPRLQVQLNCERRWATYFPGLEYAVGSGDPDPSEQFRKRTVRVFATGVKHKRWPDVSESDTVEKWGVGGESAYWTSTPHRTLSEALGPVLTQMEVTVPTTVELLRVGEEPLRLSLVR